ncbi:hypothetical protein [Flavobacterium sp. N1994]|uniref:hypothetical protein n=1 Tax=Flavobacterium sp. N1994 TaxID=2986827 RepID=UPI002221470D|nr:hypothetical protein [Flavobacterium sp. N1994]
MKTKIFKVFTIATILAMVLVIRCSFKNSEETKTPEQIQKEKQDSLASDREKKIDLALTELKELVKKQMKDPSSFELLDRTYDKKDTGNLVKLVIRYTGKNSFGAKVTSVTFGTYDIKTSVVAITETRQD